MADFPGIPGYKITRVLGEGGMATVYMGIQEKLDRKVAIKILEPILTKDKVITLSFDREAKIAANLHHSNIIQIYDTGQIDYNHYIIMEYLEESLRERMDLSPQKKIEPKAALKIMKEIMMALDYAHYRGVYHKDIKPENIMFREDDNAILGDFGIAVGFDSTKPLEISGKITGSINYISPEQCGAKEVDGRSDIYSLGAVFYEMLTGEKPYKGESQITIALQHVKGPVPTLPPGLSRYQPLIDKMMAKDREERISSGPQFMELLEIIQSPPEDKTQTLDAFSPPTMEPASPPPKISQRNFEFKKPTSDIKLLFTNYLDLLKKNLDKLRKKKFSGVMRDLLQLFMDSSIQKKLLLWILPVSVILAAILIIIFYRGPEYPVDRVPTNVDQPTPPSFLSSFFKQIIDYQNNLIRANHLYEKGDLESLKEALSTINRLKKIKPIPIVNELEEKITGRIDKLKKEYRKYYDNAFKYFKQKKYSKALENISLAKQIKTEEVLSELEALIKNDPEFQKKKRKRKDKIKAVFFFVSFVFFVVYKI